MIFNWKFLLSVVAVLVFLDEMQAYVVSPPSEQATNNIDVSQNTNDGQSLQNAEKYDGGTPDLKNSSEASMIDPSKIEPDLNDQRAGLASELQEEKLCNQTSELNLKDNYQNLKVKDRSPLEINDQDINDIKEFVEGRRLSGAEYKGVSEAQEANQHLFNKMRHKMRKAMGSNKNEPVRVYDSTNRAELADDPTRKSIQVDTMDEKGREPALKHLPHKECKMRFKDHRFMEGMGTARNLIKKPLDERTNKEEGRIQHQINNKKGGNQMNERIDNRYLVKEPSPNLKKNTLDINSGITSEPLMEGSKYRKEPKAYKEQIGVMDGELSGRKQSKLNTVPSWVLNEDLALHRGEQKRISMPSYVTENVVERKNSLKKQYNNPEINRDADNAQDKLQGNNRKEETRQDLRYEDWKLINDLRSPRVEGYDGPSVKPRYESDHIVGGANKANIGREGGLESREQNSDQTVVTTPSSYEREMEKEKQQVQDNYVDEKVNLRRFKDFKPFRNSGSNEVQDRNTCSQMNNISPGREQKENAAQSKNYQDSYLISKNGEVAKERNTNDFINDRSPSNLDDEDIDVTTKQPYPGKGKIPIVKMNRNDRGMGSQIIGIDKQKEKPDLTNRDETLTSRRENSKSSRLNNYNDEGASNYRSLKPQPIHHTKHGDSPKGFLCKNEERSRKTEISVGTLSDIIEESRVLPTTESLKPYWESTEPKSSLRSNERQPSSFQRERLAPKANNFDRETPTRSYANDWQKKEHDVHRQNSGSDERYNTDPKMPKKEMVQFNNQEPQSQTSRSSEVGTNRKRVKDQEIAESSRERGFDDSQAVTESRIFSQNDYDKQSQNSRLSSLDETNQPLSASSGLSDRSMLISRTNLQEEKKGRLKDYLNIIANNMSDQISRGSQEKFYIDDGKLRDTKKDQGNVKTVVDKIDLDKLNSDFYPTSMGPDTYNEFKDDVSSFGAGNVSLPESKLKGFENEGIEKISIQSEYETGIIKEDISGVSPGMVGTTFRDDLGSKREGENFNTGRPSSVQQKMSPTESPTSFTNFYLADKATSANVERTTFSDRGGKSGNKKEELSNYGKQEARITTDFNGKDSINIMAMILPYILPGMAGVSSKLNEIMNPGNKELNIGNGKDSPTKNIVEQNITKNNGLTNLMEIHNPSPLVSDVKVIKSNTSNEDIGIVAMIVPGLVTKEGKLTTSLTDLVKEGVKVLNKEGHVRSDGVDPTSDNVLTEYLASDTKNEKKDAKLIKEFNKSQKPTLCDDGSFYVIAKVKPSMLKGQMDNQSNPTFSASTETNKDPLTEETLGSTSMPASDANKYTNSDSQENNEKNSLPDSGRLENVADDARVSKSKVEQPSSFKCQRSVPGNISSESQSSMDEQSEDMFDVFRKQPEIYIQSYPENDFVKCTEKDVELNRVSSVTGISKRRRHISLENIPFTGDKQCTLESLRKLQDQLKSLEDGLKCLTTEESPNNLALQIKVCVDILNGTSPSYCSTTPCFSSEHSSSLLKHLKQDVNVPR